MSGAPTRGDGVGIEVAESVLRGVRLRHDAPGRLATAAEVPLRLSDDNAAIDAFVALRAELSNPDEPVRIAAFANDAMMQRIDITGRSGPDLNELRSKLDRRHGIDSSVVVDDGPRRWLVVIRWDAPAMRRLEDLAERAGFVDVAVEPSPLALARVTGPNATYLRRLVAQGESHHAVVSNRLPVCALPVSTTGRTHPDLDVGSIDITLAHFDDFLADAALAEPMGNIADRADTAFAAATRAGQSTDTVLELAGVAYPDYPDHDLRSPRRQAVALGAAVGAAGLAGPVRPVDMIITGSTVDDQFDRPWAIETVPMSAASVAAATKPTGVVRLTRRFKRS